MLAAATRSLAGYGLAACLIVVTFILAAVWSMGNVSLLALGLAILSYNAGLAASFLTALVLALRAEA
jgi:hypothetical protein